jgi:DNA (cytosine-5)-methyltransferase 1
VSAQPVLYDLGCCAGGLAAGYKRAGWYVVGFDIKAQPRYAGDEFHQADALEVDLSRADAVHGSMPCQKWAQASRHNGRAYPDLITPLRPRLEDSGKPWVMENVPGAPLRPDVVLCGCYFGLEIPGVGYLNRERWFETSWRASGSFPPHQHNGAAISIAGHGTPSWQRARTGHIGVAQWRQVMQMNWTTREELTEACPPAYGEFMGLLLMEQLWSQS